MNQHAAAEPLPPYNGIDGLLTCAYAQPLVKVVALELRVVDDQLAGMSITPGLRPTDVPAPFAQLLRDHIARRPNLRTGSGPDSPWLFPSTLAGRHLHPNTVMDRLRDLGINPLGARNRAIGELVLEAPPSLVADALATASRSLSSTLTRPPSHGPATPAGRLTGLDRRSRGHGRRELLADQTPCPAAVRRRYRRSAVTCRVRR